MPLCVREQHKAWWGARLRPMKELLAFLGVSALVIVTPGQDTALASEPAFLAVKLAGATYLVFLGAQMLVHALRRAPDPLQLLRGAARLAPRTAYRQGVVSNLGNPKMAVFFTSLLPQFAPESGPRFAAFLALGLCFSVMTAAWLTAYAFAVARAKNIFQRPRIRRVVDGFTGAVLVALGLRLASAER